MAPNSAALQSTLLKLLADPNTDNRLGRGFYYLTDAVKAKFPDGQQPTSPEIMAAVWSLVAQGLAYIDYSQPAPENWKLFLTESGRAAARDEEINPDSSGDYLKRFDERVPKASDTVKQYAREALTTYSARCYLASAVMLGAASEAAFIEMALSFGAWLPDPQSSKFIDLIKNPRSNYIAKFSEFRKQIEPNRKNLPDDLADGMTLTLDSVLDLLRIYRNEAGHPTGKKVSREDAFINLQMFARYVEKLYALKGFFDVHPKGSFAGP